MLETAGLARAIALVVAIPDPFEGGEVVRVARLANSTLRIIARADSDDGAEHLRQQGADQVVLAAPELARGMLEKLRRSEPGREPDDEDVVHAP